MKKMVLFVFTLFLANVALGAVTSTDAPELLIPVAGNVRGANGERYVTDVTLVNLSESSETVELTWLPHGGTAEPQKRTVVVEGLKYVVLSDVVDNEFGLTGLGALLIRATDGDAALDASARIRHRLGTGVELSQAVPAVQPRQWRNDSAAYVHGVHALWPRYRVNYGIVNLDDQPQQFKVIVRSYLGPQEQIVTVPANGMLQLPAPDRAIGALSLYFEPLNGSGRWHAYATAVSNEGGSGWTLSAMQPRVDIQY